MNDLKILIAEDEQRWWEGISTMLKDLVNNGVHIAENYVQAVKYVQENRYDLIVTDLALPGDENDPRSDLDRGFDLLKEVRLSSYNETCALLVVSGQIRNQQVRDAIKQYEVHYFFDKDGEFEKKAFLYQVRESLLIARVEQANKIHKRRYRLTIQLDNNRIRGSELSGPIKRPLHFAKNPPKFDTKDMARRAGNLDILLSDEDEDKWRKEAKSIGRTLFKILSSDPHILENLATSISSDDLWLIFSGSPKWLGVPFELLHDGDDYMSFKHLLTRRIVPARRSAKESFRKFISSFQGGLKPLRILIVGVDEGDISFAEKEAEMLESDMKYYLDSLGIRPEINRIPCTEATHARVSAALQYGNYHIFHYSGHGYYDAEQPEISGLRMFNDDPDSEDQALTASDLINLLRKNELRLVYLSCCLSACTTSQLNQGDFHGLFDALMRADVPMILGYRWTVEDDSAFRLAKLFYQHLWRTLLPEEALFKARLDISGGKRGRNNDTWASPVLVMQDIE